MQAAKAVTFSLGMSVSSVPGGRNQLHDSVQQLAASGLLPKLAAALPGLTAAVETAAKGHACVPAAVTVLGAVFCTIGAWQGQAGALSCRAAGPLVQPALHLAVTVIQHVVAADDAESFDIMAGYLVIVVMNLTQHMPQHADRATKQQQQQQDHFYLRSLVRSPAYLTLLLTVCCILTHSDTAVAAVISTSSAAAGAAAAAAAATSGTTASLRRKVRTSSSRCQHAGAAGTAPKAAAQQRKQQRQLHQQLARLLQTLYGHANTASEWNTLLSGSKTVAKYSWCSVAHSHELLQAAEECLSQGIMDREDELSLQQQQQFLEAQANNLRALRQLPVLLLRGMCSAAAAPAARSAAAYLGISAALSLVTMIVWCWRAQVKLQSTPVGLQIQQLPAAELLQLLLQEMDALLQLRSEAAAVITTAPPAAAAAASSSHAAINAAAASRWQRSGSAAAAAAHDVTVLDYCTMQLLETLRVLQTVSQYAVWEPHSTHLAAVVENCLRNFSSSNPAAVATTATFNLCMCNSFIWHQKFKFADSEAAPAGSEPGSLLRAAAAAGPGSREQQQLFSLLISLLKRISNLQQLGFETQGEVTVEQIQYSKGLGCATVCRAVAVMSAPNKYGSSGHADTAASLMPGSKLLCAAAPWLVAASRLVCSMTTQLADCVEFQPKKGWAYAVDGSSRSSSSSSEGAEGVPAACSSKQLVRDYYRLLKDCADGLMYSAVGLEEPLENWIGQAEPQTSSRLAVSTYTSHGGSGRTRSSRDVGAASDDNTAAMDASTAAPAAAAHDAVQELQHSVLLEAVHELEGELVPKVQKVVAACEEISRRGQQLAADAGPSHILSRFGPAAAAVAEEQLAILALDTITTILKQWGVHKLLQQLGDVGQKVGAVLPTKLCCNNTTCSNVSSSSELALVSGKGSVCSGCDTARYCGRDCQVAHWQRHKAICKAIRKQSSAK